MITKSRDCSDIHELCISQAEFERREKKKQSIYGGAILNRRVSYTERIQKLSYWKMLNYISKILKED